MLQSKVITWTTLPHELDKINCTKAIKADRMESVPKQTFGVATVFGNI